MTSRPRDYKTRPLDTSTWSAFADLVERNNGISAGAGASHFTGSTGVGTRIRAA
ncbi:MAG TPA: hypothetical protein VG405_00035 [Solirubrobacteraceae bacterium]|nr:hypothetical protein [Solirubrobacteraceae bacterium]